VKVTFITREGCPMCLDAQAVVERVTAEAGALLELADVDADPALAVWSDHVPVVLIDGVEHSRWWVSEDRLRAAL
jgi:glutaredoxin